MNAYAAECPILQIDATILAVHHVPFSSFPVELVEKQARITLRGLPGDVIHGCGRGVYMPRGAPSCQNGQYTRLIERNPYLLQ